MNDLFGSAEEPRADPAERPRGRASTPLVRDDDQRGCVVCGAAAHFGFGVALRAGHAGRWACAAHREDVKKLSIK